MITQCKSQPLAIHPYLEHFPPQRVARRLKWKSARTLQTAGPAHKAADKMVRTTDGGGLAARQVRTESLSAH